MKMTDEVIAFFDKAKKYIIPAGYEWEIDNTQNFHLENFTPEMFALQYTFVVLSSSGLNNQVVQKLYDQFIEATKRGDKDPFAVIKNKRHRQAIICVWSNPESKLQKIKEKKTDEEKIAYIRTLGQMGPKTSLHLARNIGIDCVKPDRWLWRITERYGFETPLELCQHIQKQRPELRIGSVDVILWRYCNLTGKVE